MESLPDTWHQMELRDVCRLNSRQISPEAFRNYNYYIGLEQIQKDSGRIIRYQSVNESNLKSAKLEFDENSILYGKLRPYLNKVALPNVKGICSTDILPITPNERLVLKEYLYFYLRSPSMTSWATEKSVGANLPRISPSLLLRAKVPVPPLESQRKICLTLGKAEELRQKREQANQMAPMILQAVFLRMFGESLDHFAARELGSVTSEIYRYPTYYGIRYCNEGVAEVRGELLQDDGKIEGDFRYIDQETNQRFPRTILQKGDLVMSVRGTIGKIGIADERLRGSNITANLIRISPKKELINPIFLYAFLKSPKGSQLIDNISTKTTIQTVKASLLAAMVIPIPPIELQDRFQAIVERSRELEERQKISSEETESLFNSLMSKAFKGELVQ